MIKKVNFLAVCAFFDLPVCLLRPKLTCSLVFVDSLLISPLSRSFFICHFSSVSVSKQYDNSIIQLVKNETPNQLNSGIKLTGKRGEGKTSSLNYYYFKIDQLILALSGLFAENYWSFRNIRQNVRSDVIFYSCKIKSNHVMSNCN